MRGPDAYPTVGGVAAGARLLCARHPDLCRLRWVGESAAGRALWLLSVGRGERHILVAAGVRPDEQAGGGTVLWLAEQCVADRKRLADDALTWDFVLCLDPDGTVLNETGPAGPRPPAVHFRHTYHPAPAAVDPGGAVLDALGEELRPVLRCDLRGTDVGGACVRLTAEVPGLAEPFGKYAAELDVPLRGGAYDALTWQTPGPGVFVRPRAYPPAERFGGPTAHVETPMWATRRVADPAPHPEPSHALAVMASRLRKDRASLSGALDRALPLVGPLAAAQPGAALLLAGAEEAVAAAGPLADAYETLAEQDGAVPLTSAHVADLDLAARRLPLRAAGMLLRLLDAPPFTDGDPSSEPARLRGRLERRLDASARELVAASDARWVPVYEQVELQARTVLAAVELLC